MNKEKKNDNWIAWWRDKKKKTYLVEGTLLLNEQKCKGVAVKYWSLKTQKYKTKTK